MNEAAKNGCEAARKCFSPPRFSVQTQRKVWCQVAPGIDPVRMPVTVMACKDHLALAVSQVSQRNRDVPRENRKYDDDGVIVRMSMTPRQLQ